MRLWYVFMCCLLVADVMVAGNTKEHKRNTTPRKVLMSEEDIEVEAVLSRNITDKMTVTKMVSVLEEDMEVEAESRKVANEMIKLLVSEEDGTNVGIGKYCRVMLLHSGDPFLTHLTQHLLKHVWLESSGLGVVVVETGIDSLATKTLDDEKILWWSDSKLPCLTVVILTHTHQHVDTIFSFLEVSRLWEQSESRVLVLGPRSQTQTTLLLHPALRNAVLVLYLAPTSLYNLNHQHKPGTEYKDEGRLEGE
ncbi:hypothetical protein Pcinc_035487 [Petrolisthes cinctipes]|uniref:Uncharacterized protein n=1 Tax=Petrolisthes cinctipes TaxID=88211 RepID=A0AAE1BY76_PETCI|nr:hypothetical protein Pcinc_035487 [Petrolisthes cinctipes]